MRRCLRSVFVLALTSLALGCSPRRATIPGTGAPAETRPPLSVDAGPPRANAARELRFEDGWLAARDLLVASDGTRALGDADSVVNDERDSGSKIVFFDPKLGNNETAEVYWWNGREIVDSRGRPANDAGERYGADPLEPNLAAIRPFATAIGLATNREGDLRLRTHARGFESTAGGYPDWFLFRRGRVHDTFDGSLVGGRSETEPMVIAAYGPLAEGRAVIAPAEG